MFQRVQKQNIEELNRNSENSGTPVQYYQTQNVEIVLRSVRLSQCTETVSK